ncbi:hypothetical protein AB0H77_38410, partial [Streptomyces sp. NPDC050844]|uniref:hypothetical protein n=1 Tax=Streptomyces sp. NPDC050844 TaxID=3155790 RepID=UPI0033C5B2C5
SLDSQASRPAIWNNNVKRPRSGIWPGKPGHKERIAQAQFGFPRKRGNEFRKRNSERVSIHASVN